MDTDEIPQSAERVGVRLGHRVSIKVLEKIGPGGRKIRTHPRSSWRCCYVENGNRATKYFKTKAEAEEWAKTREVEALTHGTNSSLTRISHTLSSRDAERSRSRKARSGFPAGLYENIPSKGNPDRNEAGAGRSQSQQKGCEKSGLTAAERSIVIETRGILAELGLTLRDGAPLFRVEGN